MLTRNVLLVLTVIFALASILCALELHINNIEHMLPKMVGFMFLTAIAMPSFASLRNKP